MSSGVASYGRIRFDDLQWKRGYRPNLAYAQSKLADLMLTLHLADLAVRHGWNLMSHGEFLAGQMGGADRGPGGQVPHALNVAR